MNGKCFVPQLLKVGSKTIIRNNPWSRAGVIVLLKKMPLLRHG